MRLFAWMLFFVPMFLQAQISEKKVDKINKLLKDDKYEEADKIAQEIVAENPTNENAWGILIDVRGFWFKYAEKSSDLFQNITISVEGEENDALADSLENVLKNIDLSEDEKNKYMGACREATALFKDDSHAEVLLRTNLFDEAQFSKNKEALKQFNLAEDKFTEESYSQAAKYYKKAIEIDSSFFKAKLYLGDVYFMIKEYDLAIKAFSEAVKSNPTMNDARKFLGDAYFRNGDYDMALATYKSSLELYPESLIRNYYEDASVKLEKPVSFEWSKRGCLPNVIQDSSDYEPVFLKVATSNWKHYQTAMTKVEKFCSPEGIISDNEVTKEQYLEAYSWKYMLENSSSGFLPYVRKIDAAGYLDCYVFINQFHHDLLPQFQHFVRNNAERIDAYLQYLETLGDSKTR